MLAVILTTHRLEASDAEGEANRVEDCDVAQAVRTTVAPSPAAEVIAASPAALEPVPSLAEAGVAAPAPVAITATGRGRGRGRGRGLGGRGGGAVLDTVTRLLGQASMQVSAEGSSDAGSTALVAAAAPAALDMPPSPAPPSSAVTSLADAQFSTGRPEPPESTIGGQSTCIICFTNPKTHLAAPCGHQCACADCSAQMHECPVCRTPVQMWMQVRVA